MTTADILLQDFDGEMAGVRRTLERVPEESAEYKPHEKSMAMGRLAMHVACLPLFGKHILTTPGMDLTADTKVFADLTFQGREAMLERFDAAARELREVLQSSSDEELMMPWKFTFGEHVISEESRLKSYRSMFFNHLIHHRAQVGVYLRLNEVAVPGLYGPSADEPFTP